MEQEENWNERLNREMPLPKEFKLARSRIMYIELKGDDGLEGAARIGRLYLSKSGKTLYYKGWRFQSLKGLGFKSNYINLESGDYFWISGPRKDQNDRLYGGNKDVVVDEDVRAEYEKMIAKV